MHSRLRQHMRVRKDNTHLTTDKVFNLCKTTETTVHKPASDTETHLNTMKHGDNKKAHCASCQVKMENIGTLYNTKMRTYKLSKDK